ncbi:MAG: hypothetical protein V1777_05140 [Candidatus Micrarchaeota archaeon]
MVWKDKTKMVAYVVERRRQLKRRLLELKGGKCELCGYLKCAAALEFHHLDEKEDKISNIYNQNWKRILAEADKTRLVCANCHREIHSGLNQALLLPADADR